MPVKMRKLPNKNKWRVYDKQGHIHAKSTSKPNAQKQIRLLNGLAHGMKLRVR
jgi:hypothetical protein